MDTIALDLVTDRVVLPRAVPPDVPLEQALRRRCSTRSFAPEPLSPAILSALLWAACGINRPDIGDGPRRRRTTGESLTCSSSCAAGGDRGAPNGGR